MSGERLESPFSEYLHIEGRVLAGRYRLERLLGAGGMGLVFLAEQLPLKRRVAVKLLPAGKTASEEAILRLIREAQALSQVEHEAVVRVIEAGRAETGEAFIALEYLQGLTLKQLLIEHGFLPWRWAVKATIQLLEALDAVHQKGLVHRDVKPSNCLCVSTGSAILSEPKLKLIDFGIAKFLDPGQDPSLTQSHGAVGTPAYWAPEQAMASQVDARADVYAAGATLYEILTGKLPFVASGLANPHSPEPFRAPSAVNPATGISRLLDGITLRALHRDPSKRFPSARAMLDALKEVLLTASAQETASSPAPFKVGTGERAVGTGSQGKLTSGSGILTQDEEVLQLARLRSKVETFWISGVLGRSLQAGVFAEQPRTLEDDWVAGLGTNLEAGAPRSVPPTSDVGTLFEEFGQSLLVLGEPGTGKTTQLLLLARALLAQQQTPIPVVFALATWSSAVGSLRAWLIAELRTQYQVPEAFASRWLDSRAILPLLDGLDEVPAHDREACCVAINKTVEAGLFPGLAVTTRREEYETLPIRLSLNAAIRLHRLTRESVENYFRQYPSFSGLPEPLQNALLDLATTPLALSLLGNILATPTPVTLNTNSSGEEQFAQLLDMYTNCMLTRSGKKKLPVPRDKFLAIVSHLAAALKRNNCAIFQLDSLQPSWLNRRSSVIIYALVSRILAAAVFGAGLILSCGLSPAENAGFRATLSYGGSLAVVMTVVLGFGCGLFTLWRFKKAASWSRRRHWLEAFGIAAVLGMVSAALIGMDIHPVARVIAFEVGMIGVPLLLPHIEIGKLSGDVKLVENLRFSLAYALRALPYGVAAGLAAFAVSSIDADPRPRLTVLTSAVLIWFLFGGLRGRQVGVRYTQNAGLYRSLRWSALLGGLAIPTAALPISFIYGLGFGLCFGLTACAILWLWYGGYAAIQHVVLRILLKREGQDYCNYRYLDAAADRGFLHRVGGGYMFIHPVFSAHLAGRFDARQHVS